MNAPNTENLILQQGQIREKELHLVFKITFFIVCSARCETSAEERIAICPVRPKLLVKLHLYSILE